MNILKKAVVAAVLLASLATQATQIRWSGYTWDIRSGTGGPGPNTWSEKNVFIDRSGFLHLKITKEADGTWRSVGIRTINNLTFGTYQFSIVNDVNTMDQNVVFGAFFYPTKDVGPDGTNEIDVEIAQWGNGLATNRINYTIWPLDATQTKRTTTFPWPVGVKERLFTISWIPSVVEYDFPAYPTHWMVMNGVSQKPMPFSFNLWLFKGAPPTNDKEVEVIIKGFRKL